MLGQVNAETLTFTGTTGTLTILGHCPDRKYLNLYAATGAATVTVGDSATPIVIAEGVSWEPLAVITNKIKFTGAGSTLLVLTSGDSANGLPIYYDGGDLTYGTSKGILLNN